MMTHTVLLIEDDIDLAALIREELELAGYRVRLAGTVMHGLIQAREDPPHLILLDLGLPDGDGRQILQHVRTNSEVPIIVLTARDAIGEKVELLELGADDYLVKPAHAQELLARIEVQLRPEGRNALIIGELMVVPAQRLATYQGKELHLSPREFDLLVLLMQEPGQVWSRQALFDAIWKGTLPVDTNVVEVHLANLRAKLRDLNLYGLLRTIRGRGYVMQPTLQD